MTFKITVARQPFSVEFEAGSVGEAIGIMQAEGTSFATLFDITIAGKPDEEAATETTKEKKKPGRPPKDAAAPPPVTIPGAQPDMTPNANGIPAALDRTNPAAIVNQAAPPPPLAPPAPPAPPPPIGGVVATKVIAALELRATNDDAKAQLVAWLAGSGIVIPGATYPEAISVVRTMGDDKLAGVATALAV